MRLQQTCKPTLSHLQDPADAAALAAELPLPQLAYYEQSDLAAGLQPRTAAEMQEGLPRDAHQALIGAMLLTKVRDACAGVERGGLCRPRIRYDSMTPEAVGP